MPAGSSPDHLREYARLRPVFLRVRTYLRTFLESARWSQPADGEQRVWPRAGRGADLAGRGEPVTYSGCPLGR